MSNAIDKTTTIVRPRLIDHIALMRRRLERRRGRPQRRLLLGGIDAPLVSTFTERTTIDASREDVWAALADIGTIATWNPGLIGSHRTNDIDGVGGARHCDISTRHSLTEHVIEFEPGTAITFRITESTLPFKTADIAFTLTDSRIGARTEVAIRPTYTLAYGPIGQLLDTVAVRRRYRAGMRELLDGLKHHLEQAC